MFTNLSKQRTEYKPPSGLESDNKRHDDNKENVSIAEEAKENMDSESKQTKDEIENEKPGDVDNEKVNNDVDKNAAVADNEKVNNDVDKNAAVAEEANEPEPEPEPEPKDELDLMLEEMGAEVEAVEVDEDAIIFDPDGPPPRDYFIFLNQVRLKDN